MLRRLLAVAGLTGLVVAQPLLDILGDSPATFEVHEIEGRKIILFAVLLAAVPPLVLWAVTELIRRVHEPAGEVVHRLTVGGLLAAFGILLAKLVTDTAVVNLAVGAALGLGGALLYVRYESIRLWLRLLTFANVLFLYQFVYVAPVADWIDSASGSPEVLAPVLLDGATSADKAPPSVFMLVLDELPTQTLLTPEGTIDDVRFPNLAAFAAESTFHRHFTTLSPFTHSAVPSLLDGREPTGEPTWTDHPQNLFNLFAGSHHLVVSEFLTRLCGFDTCGRAPIAPPPIGSNAAPTTASPVEPAADASPRWRDLIGTSWNAWTAHLAPSDDARPETFDDFREQFRTATSDVDPTGSEPTVTTPSGDDRTEEEKQLETFFDLQTDAQPARLEEFLDAVRPSDRPMFGYLHLVLPHQPWVVREDGTIYDVAADRTTYDADNDDPWTVEVGRQRHVLQMQYTDRIIGQFLRHLDDQGLYDDSLVVILSDHGAAFSPGGSSRSLDPASLPSVAYVPLFIKAPGQASGIIDDQNLTSVDLAPTIADLLNVGLPWEVDGVAAGDPAIDARGTDKLIYDYRSAYEYTAEGTIEFDDETAWRALLADVPPTLAADADPVSGLYQGLPGSEHIGADASDVFGPVSGPARVVEIARIEDPGEGPLLGELAGSVPGAPVDAVVLVAINDRIIGVSPLYRRDKEDRSFVVLLSGTALDPKGNTVRLGLRQADGTTTELEVR